MTFSLEGFEIGRRLGSGGFGDVWEARQLGVDRLVAIKVGNTPIADAADQLRFERECKALGRLSTHPNIVTVYTSSRLGDGRPVLVLEYVDGGTLQQWALHNPSSEPQLLNLGADLSAAVVEAHRQKILHRDLKPQNVLLRTTGEAILADFGIAQLQDGLRTVTGNVTASAAYAAPEVLDGERASERSDLYGIGICLLAAATQSTPFTTSEDDTLYPVLTRVLTAAPPDLTEHGYSPELNSLLQRLLAKAPNERPDSALSVLAEFQGMNAGLHRHQRVTPVATVVFDDEGPTEGPESRSLDAPAAASSPPVASEAAFASPPATAPPPATSPPVAPITPEAPPTVPVAEFAPATAPAPVAYEQATGAPVGAATAPSAAAPPSTPVVEAPSTSGPSPGVLAAVVGAVALVAIALFLVFGRSPTDDRLSPTAPTPVNSASQADASEAATAPPTTQQSAASTDSPSEAATEPPSDAATTSESAPVQPLPITEPLEVADSLDIALDFRDYPLELVAGQEVSVEIDAMNGSCESSDKFDLRVDLLGPDGEPVGNDGWPGNWGCKGFGGSEWKVDQDGLYTVRFSSGQGGSNISSTGTFQATIATLRRQTEEIDLTASLVTVDGVIDRALDSTSYLLDLRAGQAIGVGIENINGDCDGSSRFDLRFTMFDPNGEQLGDVEWPGNWGCGESGRWDIEIDGRHRLEFFSDDDTGAFQATFGLLRQEATTLDATERVHQVQHTFEIPRDQVDYAIDLEQGQSVSVEVTSFNGSCDRADRVDLKLRLLNSAGEQIDDEEWPGNWGCRAFGPWEAPATGTYRIQFYEDAGGIGAFEATIGRLGG